MTRRPPGPQPWLRWLLEAALPATVAGRSIAGDVIEEFHQRPPGIRRQLWFALVTVRLAAVYIPLKAAAALRIALHLRTLGDDLRAGVRALRRDRATVALAIVTLGVGIGSVTAILSALHGSLLKPLPFPRADRLVVVADRSADMRPNQIAGNIALVNVRDITARAGALQSSAADRDVAVTVAGRGETRRLRGQEVDAGFFETLGRTLEAGRPIAAADAQPGAAPVVVIAATLWRSHFSADPAIVGSTVRIDGVPRTVIGIAPAITQLGNPQLWLPLVPDTRALTRTARQVYAVARLSDGASLEAARSELGARFDDLRRDHPEIGERRAVGVMPLEEWLIGASGRSLLWLLAGAVALVLVVACVNVTNLLLVRAERRQPDLALRAALGATRARLVRELIAESVVLSLAGAALGLLFASWCVRVLVDLYGPVLPRAWEIELDAGILFAACAIAIGTGLAVAMPPAMRLPGAGVRGALTQDRVQSRATGSQRLLVAFETAIAMLLLALAGLLVNTVARLSAHDLGIRADGAALFDISFTGRFPSAAAGLEFLDRLTTRLQAVPGVTHAAAASRRPLFGGNNSSFVIAGQETPPFLEFREVTPTYFAALGVPLRRGRLLTAADRAGDHVVVNRAFERTLFPASTAIGQRLRSATGDPRWFDVVGVVEDVREFGPAADPRPTVYFAYGRGPYGMSPAPTIIMRVASGDPMEAIAPARAVLRELDADVALDDPVTLAAQAQSRIGRDRLALRALLSLAGALALALTVVGIYGVTACSVARRTREIGIRRALGATRSGIVWLLVRQAGRQAMPGLLIGVAASLAGGRLVASYLHGVQPTDPATLLSAAALLTAAIFGACWVPARRAGRVDAVEALRS